MQQPYDNAPDLEARFIAELLSARAQEFADAAAGLLLHGRPEIAARYHPLAHEKWHRSLTGRIHDLAAAIHVRSPALFRTQIEWARAAFESRGTPVDDLRASLESVGKVLERELSPEDVAHVLSFVDEARASLELPMPEGPGRLSARTPHGQLGAAYLLKLLEGDRLGASRTLLEAHARGLSTREAYLAVLMPVQHELGRMWHLNEISVAEEHFATATTEMVMSQLLVHAERCAPNGLAVLAAAVDGNTHGLGIRMVADFFELDGWRAVYLGANCPGEDLAQAVADFKVDLVALSVALPTQLRTLGETIDHLRSALGDRCPRIIVGGCGFGPCQDVWRGLGADGYAYTADDAVALGRRLLNIPALHG